MQLIHSRDRAAACALLVLLAGCLPAPPSTPALPLPGELAMRAAEQAVLVYVPAGAFRMGGTAEMTR